MGRAAALAATFCLGASPAAAAPLEAYGRLPAIEGAAVSPDGELIAAVVTNGEARTVALTRATDLKPFLKIPAGEKKVRWIQWAGSNHLIVTTSRTTDIPGTTAPRGEWFVAIDYNLKTHSERVLPSGVPRTIDAVLAPPMVRVIGGRPFAFVEAFHFSANSAHVSLFKVDLDSGLSGLIQEGQPFNRQFLVDDQGETLALAQYDPQSRRWSVKVERRAVWHTVKSLDAAIETPEILGLGRDGKTALVYDDMAGASAMHEIGRDSEDWGAAVAADPQAEPIHDPTTGRLVGLYALDGDQDRYVFFDPMDQKRWDAVVRAYPGERVTLASVSADHQKMIVLADSPTDGPAYAFVDIPAGSSRWLGLRYPTVKSDVAPVTPIAFKAADGTPLTGYLTLPNGRAPKGLPLVVLPHGGPASRDDPGFDWWAQAMASRGYAVLQVNYRGSEGFGWKFLAAGFGEYGRKMQTDLSDGVRWLASQGTIDPKRVCVVGDSYGGYAALAGVTLDPGVYRCAVSVAGVSDMKRMVAWSKNRNSVASERYWDRYVGVDKGRSLDDISPIHHLDRVMVPVLLIHGKDDTVVPYEQSRMMANALQKAGKNVRLVTLQSEDHWLSRGETRLQMLQATMDFLGKYNPPN
ncbi:MAG TPA: S9 family peptidase [Caulobacteraceae bacterium]|nr:S9 family peptidase [Caulobacteraceae bacterium]